MHALIKPSEPRLFIPHGHVTLAATFLSLTVIFDWGSPSLTGWCVRASLPSLRKTTFASDS